MSLTTRRSFIAKTAAITLSAAQLKAGSVGPAVNTSTRRVLGSNDRINFGFIGMGGRMSAHTGYAFNRQKTKGDVQCLAICDIYEKNKKRGQKQTGVEDKNIHHDYRELCARKDIDAVFIATPDHWHSRQAIEALSHGKHVYVEKPMTYAIPEARELAQKVAATKLQLQVGSQHLSDLQFWKAKELIAEGAIGKVLWATTSYSRNTPTGEWNYYTIDPDNEANEKTIDWKAFLGYAKKRPFDKDRFFRWRKYWDYSGGMATDLFYHRLSPIMMAIGNPEFPAKVMAGGGIYSPVDGDVREVPDTYFTSIEFPGKYAILISSSMLNATGFAEGQPQLIRGTKGTLYLDGNKVRVVPEKPYKEEFRSRYKVEELIVPIAVDGEYQGKPWTPSHQGNFINAIRGTEKVHFDVELGYKAMVAIRLGIDSYRSGQVERFSPPAK